MDPLPSEIPPPAGADAPWHPLPRRARPLMVLALVPAFALPLTVAATVLATAFDLLHPLLAGGIAFMLAALAGVWRGFRQYAFIGWRLDDDGLGVRRGSLWQRETRVPASRVQHLDIKRGPLQRRRGLATLVVHTAGSRLNTVTLPHLDDADAERLRDVLSRRIDDVDD
jgi:membrane protein YdbS with pleckstrin-like domain